MDLTFQVPMQYCSLLHWTFLCHQSHPQLGIFTLAPSLHSFWCYFSITWTTALFNPMKLWAIPCSATHNGRIMVESSDKMWSSGEGIGKPLQCSCLENLMDSVKRKKDTTLKDELTRLVGVQHAPGDQWRNNSRKNEEMEPKQKHQSYLIANNLQHYFLFVRKHRNNVEWNTKFTWIL